MTYTVSSGTLNSTVPYMCTCDDCQWLTLLCTCDQCVSLTLLNVGTVSRMQQRYDT